jgi:hypothetical protein
MWHVKETWLELEKVMNDRTLDAASAHSLAGRGGHHRLSRPTPGARGQVLRIRAKMA